MSGPLRPFVDAAVLLGVLGVGIYAVAVLDGVFRELAGGGRARVLALAARPWRTAARRLLRPAGATERPDGALWGLTPPLLGALAAVGAAAVPVASGVGAADVASGIVLFGAAMALVMVAVFLHGWAPNSELSLLGGYRFVAQALSYEMPLALVLIAAALPARSLAVGDIVASQASLWNVVRQPLGLPLFLVAGLGLAFWGPFAWPDAQDLAGGTRVELSGPGLLLWATAQAAVLVAVATMAAATFLGGWLGPWLPGPLWLALKALFLLAVLVAARHWLARVRLQRFVVVAWTVLIPLALLDVFGSGMLALWG